MAGLLVAACGEEQRYPPIETNQGGGSVASTGSVTPPGTGGPDAGCFLTAKVCQPMAGETCPEGQELVTIMTASGCTATILSDGMPPVDGMCCGDTCVYTEEHCKP